MSTAADADAGPPPGPAPSTTTLSAQQLHALFDILTHYETYQEIQDFKDPATIYSYGCPFVEKAADAPSPAKDDGSGGGSSPSDAPGYAAQSSSPILHMLFNKTVLSLPPAKTLPPDFWRVRVQGLIAQLGEAELSESYDQGAMGTRKMLATASSALIESLGRGALGGYPGLPDSSADLAGRTYDTTSAAGFARAWDDVLRAMVYGDLVDELFAFCAENGSIEGHSPAVKAAADYIIIHLAEFLHYVFVLSPNGRYLTKLADSIQMLVPYSLVRQTLRVSNAATMINGMMKLLLAKLSVGGLTNWMGLTSSADDGMNLLQRIISLVLSYDASNFKKAADKIDKAKDGPSKAHLAAIKEHLARPRQYHDAVRRAGAARGQSADAAVLASVDPALVASLTDATHAQCAQYYAAHLSIRDRREITSVFCRQSPDLFTQALRDGVAAFDPIIRGLHDKIDLKEHVSDMEGFVNEFLEVSKGTKPPSSSSSSALSLLSSKKSGDDERVLPTVKDYVELLRRNRHLLYKWLHRVARDTPDIRDTFRGWAVDTIKVFRGPTGPPRGGSGGGGAMDEELGAMFAALPADVQSAVLPRLDDHAAYLSALDAAAAAQRQALLDKINSPAGAVDEREAGTATTKKPGAGRFLARWQELLDATVIGPATVEGPLRHGRDVAQVTAPGKAAAQGSGGGGSGSKFSSSARSSRQPSLEPTTPTVPVSATAAGAPPPPTLQPPDATPVVEAMARQFRQLLVELTIHTEEK